MKKLTIRLSEEMSAALAQLASSYRRSVNQQVVFLIDQALKNEKSPQKSPQDEGTQKEKR